MSFFPIAFLRNLPWRPAWEVNKILYFGASSLALALDATTLVPTIIPFLFFTDLMAGDRRKKKLNLEKVTLRPVASSWNVLLTAYLIFFSHPLDLSLNITCPESLPNHLSPVDTPCDG